LFPGRLIATYKLIRNQADNLAAKRTGLPKKRKNISAPLNSMRSRAGETVFFDQKRPKNGKRSPSVKSDRSMDESDKDTK
jgi:hypothetical protein